MAIVCPSCGFRNPEGARFCSGCGSALSQPCPSCGVGVALDAAFCPHCETRLSFGAEFAERKTVTVLFADLVGSTSVGERLDVETHQALLSAYFDAMRAEAESVGGTVEQFVGDAVLVVFGLPIAHEDDADRALEAARRMLERLGELNRGLFARHGLGLEARIGVNTGEVVAPPSGAALGALAGDTLNVAARLAGHAEPGGILVSEATARVARVWQFRPAGSVELKGRSMPVATLEVIGALGAVPRGGAPAQAPITGREHELATLTSLLGRVHADRRPHVVTVSGPAGIGKSRLTAEFAAAARRTDPTTRVLVGRCRPYGEGVAFGALAEILSSLASIGESDPAEDAAARVDTLVGELASPEAPAPEGVADVLAYAAGLAQPPALAGLPAPQVRAAIRDAWVWLLDRLAASGLLVMIIEDMHWADPAFIDVLEEFADRLTGPILMLCPARPAFFDDRASWGGGRQNFSSIVLNPLGPSDGRAVVDWYLGSEPTGMIGDRILERADGNPYFIEEIVRGLIDDGTVVRDGAVWRVAGNPEHLQIPQTVQAVIASRIDLLDVPDKRVLQAAAVIGRTFWTGAVAHLLGATGTEVQWILDRLETRGLVLADPDSVLSDEREYRFKHSLVREVAYHSLTRRDRSGLHRAVADWLRRGSDASRREMVALEAHHLAQAYDGLRGAVTDEAEADALRSRAILALLAASESARLRVALGQARYFASQARRFAASPLEASRAAEALGEAFFYAYQGDPAWRALQEAIDLRIDEETDEPDPDVARLCARALQLLVRWPGAMQTRPDEITVLRYLHLGMDHAAPRSEDAVRLLTLKGFWQHAFPRADDELRSHLISPEESLRSGEQAVIAARAMQRPDLESAAHDAVTGYYIPRGLYSAARPHTRRRLELIPELDDLWEIGDTYAMQGWVGYHLGDYREAAKWSDIGYNRTVSEAPSLALQCLRWRAKARFRMGDWDGVRRDVGIARSLLGEERDDPPSYLSPMFAAAALVHEYRGEQLAADSLLDMLRALYERRSFDDRDPLPLSQWAEFTAPILARRGLRADARRLLAQSRWRRRARLGLICESRLEVIATCRDWETGDHALDEARGVAAEGGLRSLAAAADAFEGLMLREGDELEAAMAMLAKAAGEFERIGAAWDAARTRLSLAQTFERAGFSDRAAAEARRCLPALERLGARREIDGARELI